MGTLNVPVRGAGRKLVSVFHIDYLNQAIVGITGMGSRQQSRRYLFAAIELAQRFINAKMFIAKKGYSGNVPGASIPGAFVTQVMSKKAKQSSQ